MTHSYPDYLVRGGLLHTLYEECNGRHKVCICLGGNSGTGKSGLAKAIATAMKIPETNIVSADNLARALAVERFPSDDPVEALKKFEAIAQSDGGVIDRTIDDYTENAMDENLAPFGIFEGRLVPWLAQRRRNHSVIIEVRARNRFERIFEREVHDRRKRGDNTPWDFEDSAAATTRREEAYCARFKQFYGPEAADYLNSSYFTHRLNNDASFDELVTDALNLLGVI